MKKLRFLGWLRGLFGGGGRSDWHIVENDAPGLSEKIRGLSVDQRRRALARACRAMAKQIPNLEPAISTLIEAAVNDNALSPQQVAQARTYAEMADERDSAEEDERGGEQVANNWFANARVATALENAFGGTKWTDAADAAYELCCALDDQRAAVLMVRAELEREHPKHSG
jgi:hypothetical protein